MTPDARRGLEAALGEPLRDDQRVYVYVVTPGVAPSEEQRAAALADLKALREKGAAHCAAQGVSENEIDDAIEEAMSKIRPRKEVP